ncbi:hypothetical protein C8R42DRAFT_679658 [Lentinula raphanica]|nr:hypothetical protein C8R42DRAFT_679658 [Lentinula raphanica]
MRFFVTVLFSFPLPSRPSNQMTCFRMQRLRQACPDNSQPQDFQLIVQNPSHVLLSCRRGHLELLESDRGCGHCRGEVVTATTHTTHTAPQPVFVFLIYLINPTSTLGSSLLPLLRVIADIGSNPSTSSTHLCAFTPNPFVQGQCVV